ncbi:unnamed protein product [Chrysodeixis includens]|uniref:Uncharacterized protein n=1 Tax=Chrysodeixis includens TaxID=689277 RepID=A0A9P0FVP3_CHRIL|nr:unnamed protein product [Chrysodeixis includens]
MRGYHRRLLIFKRLLVYNKMGFRKVTHVLFDMDGLILNSEILYSMAIQNILSRYGKEYTFEFKQKLMGLQSHESAKMIISTHDLPLSVEEMMEESNKQFLELFPNSELMPGAKNLIEHFHKHNVPMALATMSSKFSYDLKTAKHQDLFDMLKIKTIGSSDPEVKRGKPYPDIFLITANRFPDKPKPEQCLVFEDAVNGVVAAKAAGMQVVMVPDPRVEKSATADATLVLSSLVDFKPELFGLPAFTT